MVAAEIMDPEKVVVVSTSPSVRAALGEEFGMEDGSFVQGRMVALLRALGADYVLDTNFAADLTIMEEASELIGRITEGNRPLQMCIRDSNVKIHANIQQLIWNKLFTNVSLSAVTGILQVDMGYIASNEHAWAMTRRLIKEAVAVAHAMGCLLYTSSWGTPWLPMSRNIPPSLQARVPLRHMRNILISSTWFQAGSSSACASATAWWKKSATRPAT